ncbi:diiron oxygenase [Streptomyces sp. NPDC003027]
MTSATGLGDDWYESAGVRAGPRRLLREEVHSGLLFFPPHLVPYWDHPLVGALPPHRKDELLARHLYQYLEFTSRFETRVVNRATEQIAEGHSGVDAARSVRLQAYRIYCDEAYHSLYSLDVVDQIATACGTAPLPYDFQPFLRRLDAAGEQLMPQEPGLAQMLQVVVFETLVTALLKDIPRDGRVLSLVRDTVRDHAKDEGRHHVFFSHFFGELWKQQDTTVRVRAARCLPELVRRSLLPYLEPLRRSLVAAGLTATQAQEVLYDSYPDDRVDAGIRDTARHSLRLFEDNGVLDVPGARDAFAAARLVD